MLFDDKGKLFGKISIIDLLIVVLVVAAIGGVYFKFFVVDKGTSAGHLDTIQYQVKTITGVRQFSVDAIEEGIDVFDGINGRHMGKVVKLEATPSKDFITKADGTNVEAEKPDRFDVVVTIEVQGAENDYGYFANGNLEIKRGSDFTMRTRKVELETRIKDIEVVE